MKTLARQIANLPPCDGSAYSWPAGVEIQDPSGAPRRIKPEWQKYYHRLLELRDQLRRQMNGLAEESAQESAGYSLHMADSARTISTGISH